MHIYFLRELQQLQEQEQDASARQGDERNKQVIFKICTPFTDNNIGEIKNTHVDNAKDLIVLMQMYYLIELSDDYSKTSSLYQYQQVYFNITEMIQMITK